MTWIALVGIAILIGVVALKLNESSSGDVPQVLFSKQKIFLTLRERDFLQALNQALGQSYRVFTKVKLADLVVIRSGQEQRKRAFAANLMMRQTVDFVICDASGEEVLAAIDLDDEEGSRDRQREAFVEQAFSSAEVPYGRVPLQLSYPVSEVKDLVMTLLNVNRLPAAESEETVSLSNREGESQQHGNPGRGEQ